MVWLEFLESEPFSRVETIRPDFRNFMPGLAAFATASRAIRSSDVILQVFYRPDVVRPGRKEPHSVVHAGDSERLVMSGLIGVKATGP